MAVTELSCGQRNFGKNVTDTPEDAYLVALQLRACPGSRLVLRRSLCAAEDYAES
jgi:hypothetical protein